MYELEEVTDKEGKELAKEIGAIYAKTSAKQANGIDDLFNIIGKKFVNPEMEDDSNLTREEREKKMNERKINSLKQQNKQTKKGCGCN
jgi:tRNA U34 5-carboxymethylaminomethyl modifying GTPase MnmE/TrmE